MKASEHANARKIDKEVAFNWWIPHAVKKREATMYQVTSRIRRTAHTHSTKAPTSINQETLIDSRNKNNF